MGMCRVIRGWIGSAVLCGWLMAPLPVMAADWYVATNGNNTSRDSWPTAWTNLQDALDAAVSNDTIHVAGHTFHLPGQLSWSVSYVTIRGGYEATNLSGTGSNNPALWPTVLTRSPSSSNRIMLVRGVTNGVLERVTVTRGYPWIKFGTGAGMLISNAVNLTVSSCIISNNEAYWLGGLYQKETQRGGGLCVINSTVAFTECRVAENRARVTQPWTNGDGYSQGGGLYAQGGAVTLRNCVFLMNHTFSGTTASSGNARGSGIYFNGGIHSLTNCLVSGNYGDSDQGRALEGAGLYNNGATVILQNCTVAANNGEGVRHAAGSMVIRDSILWANGDDVAGAPVLDHCSVENGDGNGVDGNLIADPRFEYGFYLGGGSGCINAGGRDAVTVGLDGRTTLAGGTTDGGLVDLGYHHQDGKDPSCADLYVVQGNPDGNAGTNWAMAIGSLTEALARAQAGTRMGTHVHVRSGTYDTGAESFPLVIRRPGIRIVGTNRAETLIDAGRVAQVLVVNQAPLFRIEGVTIANGYTNCTAGSIIHRGAGVAFNSAAGGVVSDCVIRDNLHRSSAAYNILKGGGLGAYNSLVTVSNSLIVSNKVNAGVGQNYGHNRPEGNAQGGGLYFERGAATIRNCVVLSNEVRASYLWGDTGYEGAAMSFRGGSHTVKNSLLARNSGSAFRSDYGPFRGDGVFVAGGASVILDNCTLAHNGRNNPQGAQGAWSAATLVLTNCILWGSGDEMGEQVAGAIQLRYSCVEDGDSEGVNGCTAVNPDFADTNYYHLGSAHGHYAGGFFSGGGWVTQSVHSPLIDAGAAGVFPSGEPPPDGGRVNLGAYGNTAVASKSPPLTVTNAPSSAITTNSATLNGLLQHVGSVPVTLWFYWGLTDGTNNPAAWDDGGPVAVLTVPGTFSTNVSGLLNNTIYHFTCFASNAAGATAWARPSSNVVIQRSPPEVINLGVDHEKTTSPILRGKVTSTGGEVPAVFFCWGPADGGTAGTGNWEHVVAAGTSGGFFSNTISTVAGSNYFYTCYATNASGAAWAEPALPFGARRIRYVDGGAAAGGTGYDWDHAFRHIQDALDDCRDDETNVIRLKAGTYILPAALDPTVSGIEVWGGYEGTGTPGARDPDRWPTILTNATLSIRLLDIAGRRSIGFDGITFTGGKVASDGGGVRILSSTNITFRQCTIRGNLADYAHGGGMKVGGSSGIILDACEVSHNTAHYGGVAQWSPTLGGGLYVDASSVLISNTVVRANLSRETRSYMYAHAAGLYVSGGGVTLRDSMLYENTAIASGSAGTSLGGGVHFAGGTHAVVNCLILKNTLTAGTARGHGVYGNAAVSIANSTIADNFGEGVRQAGGSMAVTNSILWNNGDDVVGTVSLASCDVQDGDNNLTNGCFMVNPRFEYGYYLADGSPCRDAGAGTAESAGLADYTTRADGTKDTGPVDVGYHHRSGIDAGSAHLFVNPATGSDSNTGTNWAGALRTLTCAIQRASFGTRIYLAAGAYTNGAEAFPISVTLPGLWIVGTNAATTVLDAAGSGQRVMNILDVGGCRLEGVTLQNGDLSEFLGRGGGLYVSGASDLAILSCVFQHNTNEISASYDMLKGGGICVYDSTVTISNCVVTGNRVHSGQGQSYGQGRAEPNSQGGGIHIYGGQTLVMNTIISSNRAHVAYAWGDSGHTGGGISYRSGTHVLRNSLVTRNSGSSYRNNYGPYVGDGVGIHGSASVTLENCTIVSNGYASSVTGQGVCVAGASMGITNCIVWGNPDDLYQSAATVAAGYSCFGDGDYNTTNACIMANPLFKAPLAGDYTLQNGSPGINAGIVKPWMPGAKDLMGNPRKSGVVDMGCYEALSMGGSVFMLR